MAFNSSDSDPSVNWYNSDGSFVRWILRGLDNGFYMFTRNSVNEAYSAIFTVDATTKEVTFTNNIHAPNIGDSNSQLRLLADGVIESATGNPAKRFTLESLV